MSQSLARLDNFQGLLQALKAAPEQVEHWHRLCLFARDHPACRADVLAQLEGAFTPDGTLGFLCATFLLVVSEDTAVDRARYFLQARQALDACGPDHAAKAQVLAVLMPSVWMLACRSHSQAQAWLLAARWPALMQAETARLLPLLTTRSATPADEPLRRVALVVPILGTLSHPPTRLAHAHRQLLWAAGLQAAVFSAEETRADDLAQHCGLPLQNAFKPHEPKDWVGPAAEPDALWCANPARPIADRRLELLQRVADFAPQAVFYVGLPSPVTALLARQHPLVVLSAVGIQPIGPADVWLASRAATMADTDQPDPQPFAYAYRHNLAFDVQRVQAWPRTRLGASSKTLLLISVGVRLSQDIDGPWAQDMLTLLRSQPRLRWLLVGGGLPAALAPLADQVQVLPVLPEADLVAVLKACDIAINPPRLGGGLSVALAMACGLPVVSLADCDGGDKLGDAASATQADYFEQLRLLLASKAARRTCGLALQQRHHQHLDLARAGPALLQALALARQRFSQRFNQRQVAPAA